MKRLLLILIASLLGCGGGCGFVDHEADVARIAPQYFERSGFHIVNYQGWQVYPPTGRCYWYTLERQGKLWESCLMLWGGELHEYNLRSLEAIRTP